MQEIKPKILAQKGELVLASLYEEVYFEHGNRGKRIFITEIYGEAACGLIVSEDCCFVGTENLLYWNGQNLAVLSLDYPFDLRLVSEEILEILTDPWAENSAIWQFNFKTQNIQKVAGFPFYRNKPYAETISW